MERSNGKFLLGIGIGIATGLIAYKLAHTCKAKELKKQMCSCMNDLGNKACEMLNDMKEKAPCCDCKTEEEIIEETVEIKK